MIGINPIFIFIVRWVNASITQSHNKNFLAKASILACDSLEVDGIRFKSGCGDKSCFIRFAFKVSPRRLSPFESVTSGERNGKALSGADHRSAQ